jgi:hypothetical protein
VTFKMTVKKKLPTKRLSVTLPGEIHAKLELYLRDFAEGAVSNDVIAEALRVCFEADKAFCRAWDAESARTGARGMAESARAAGTSRAPARLTTPHDLSENGSIT